MPIKDAFSYGAFKQMAQFAKRVGHQSMKEGLNQKAGTVMSSEVDILGTAGRALSGAGKEIKRSFVEGGDMNQARHAVKSAIAAGDRNLDKASRRILENNADVIAKAQSKVAGSAGAKAKTASTVGADASQGARTKAMGDYFDAVKSGTDTATTGSAFKKSIGEYSQDDLTDLYGELTGHMQSEGMMTRRGKVATGLAAYTTGAKVVRDDNKAPLVPFL